MSRCDGVPLVCPRCRVPGPPGARREGRLGERVAGGLACEACGLAYPVVDGVACVPPDLASFHDAQDSWMEPGTPPLDPSAGVGFCRELAALDPSSVAFREAVLLGLHAAAQYPEACHRVGMAEDLGGNVQTLARLEALVRSAPLPADAPVPAILEAGCGAGRLVASLSDAAPAGSVGLDLRISLLRLGARVASGRRSLVGFRSEGCRFEPLEVPGRQAPGPVRFVQGDVVAPPFPAEGFAAVVAISLLDTVPDPFTALGQMDALLAPGGLLLLASPWQWEAAVTPPAAWWSAASVGSGEVLATALSGGNPGLPHLGYEMLARCDLPWALPGHRRLVHRYSLDVLLARKRR